MNFAIDRTPLALQVARRLRSAFSTGDKLPSERSLAERLGVSRPALREAIKQLESEGYLEVRHGSGITVIDKPQRPVEHALQRLLPSGNKGLQHLAEARFAIEPELAALAASRRSQKDLKLISKHLDALPDASSPEESDIAFHSAIADASRNPALSLMLASIGEILRASRATTLAIAGIELANAHHRAIYEAIEKQDADAARSAMQAHIQITFPNRK